LVLDNKACIERIEHIELSYEEWNRQNSGTGGFQDQAGITTKESGAT
jgi:hypothetical protein